MRDPAIVQACFQLDRLAKQGNLAGAAGRDIGEGSGARETRKAHDESAVFPDHASWLYESCELAVTDRAGSWMVREI